MPELAVSLPAMGPLRHPLHPTRPTPASPTAPTSPTRPTAPPRGRNGRPFYIDTPLGQLISDRGLKVYDVVAGAHVNPRTMSDYLSKRKRISAPHKLAIATFLGVRVEDLDESTTPEV